MGDEDPTTQELRLDQLEREREERHSAGRALAPEEAEQHRRRADKAGYLRQKLEERARAERRGEGGTMSQEERRGGRGEGGL